jgi:hypothetical protein
MTRLSQRLVMLYLALLLALAALGAHNQVRRSLHADLLSDKAALQDQISSLRRNAAEVTGALAVRAWAHARGMVPAPEVANVAYVAPAAPPEEAAQPSELEVYTVWR